MIMIMIVTTMVITKIEIVVTTKMTTCPDAAAAGTR